MHRNIGVSERSCKICAFSCCSCTWASWVGWESALGKTDSSGACKWLKSQPSISGSRFFFAAGNASKWGSGAFFLPHPHASRCALRVHLFHIVSCPLSCLSYFFSGGCHKKRNALFGHDPTGFLRSPSLISFCLRLHREWSLFGLTGSGAHYSTGSAAHAFATHISLNINSLAHCENSTFMANCHLRWAFHYVSHTRVIFNLL